MMSQQRCIPSSTEYKQNNFNISTYPPPPPPPPVAKLDLPDQSIVYPGKKFSRF